MHAEMAKQGLLQLAGPLLMAPELARPKDGQQHQARLWAVQQLPLLLWLCLQDPGGVSAVLLGPALLVTAPFLANQPEHAQHDFCL